MSEGGPPRLPELQESRPVQPVQPSLVDIINAIAERAEPIIKLVTTFYERSLKAQEASARFSTGMAIVAAFIITLIVVVSGFLTYSGKLDGASFTFLLGLVVGYLLNFLRDAIVPPSD
jgi:hypothetical protein